MTASDEWRISSHSGQNNNCVEVAAKADRAKVRDTKSRTTGTLVLNIATWHNFLEDIKSN